VTPESEGIVLDVDALGLTNDTGEEIPADVRAHILSCYNDGFMFELLLSLVKEMEEEMEFDDAVRKSFSNVERLGI
jgi:hypothetical protein